MVLGVVQGMLLEVEHGMILGVVLMVIIGVVQGVLLGVVLMVEFPSDAGVEAI